jgi:hypothetical protein
MRKILFTILTLILLSLSGITMVLAQDGLDGTAFAAVDAEGQLVVVKADGSVTTVSTFKNFFALDWSDDGSTLAYIAYNDSFTPELWVIEPGLESSFKLEAGALEAGFPIVFTPDGQILYVQPGDFSAEIYQPRLMTIAPEAGAQPDGLGTIDMMVGCGGGSPYPAEGQYWGETGFGGQPMTLLWTDYGILYSTSCGGLGLALFDPATGEERDLPTSAPEAGEGTPQAGYGNVVLSADGQTLAALHVQYSENGPQRSLALIDMASGEVTDVTTSAEPEQIAWGPDGTLIYASREHVKDLLADLSDEGKANVEQFLGEGVTVPANQVSITQINPETGEESVLYDSYAYAVGRMVWTDGRLIFSTIANMDEWVMGLADGSFDPMNESDDVTDIDLVPVSLMSLVLGEDASFIGNFSKFELQ